MEFRNLDELRRIAGMLTESDFEKAGCRWEASGNQFTLETSRPPTEPLKGGGLFRKRESDWLPCRLVIQGVKGISLWEEYDVKPPLAGLLEAGPAGPGFRIHLRSAHGLRVDLELDRLEGHLFDVAG